jgi:hypothetical protein
MPTAAEHEPASQFNDERAGRIPPEAECGLDETKPLEPQSRPLGPSRVAMTARLKRIRDKLRQQRQRP